MEACTDIVRFNYIFDKWGKSYDDTVYQKHGEYHEVFDRYEEILKNTAEKIEQPRGALVVDIGTGTGNLAAVVSSYGYTVIGIEPNDTMRLQAIQKHPHIHFTKGHFLDLNFERGSVDSIVCSFAFHHLTDEEKALAVEEFYQILSDKGTVVIADTMYAVLEEGKAILKEAVDREYFILAQDLQREYYTTHAYLKEIFEKAGFSVSFERMNKFVWILQAKK